MRPSDRPVVDQTYQVALNVTFKNKVVQDEYQVHPQHVEFVEKVFKQTCDNVVVYDFGDWVAYRSRAADHLKLKLKT